jgi:hypothetical protein
MRLQAVFTGDSRNYHIFQIVDDNVVGSIYISKDVESTPKTLEIENLTAGDIKWKTLLTVLASKARPGSKQAKKLERVLQEATYGSTEGSDNS